MTVKATWIVFIATILGLGVWACDSDSDTDAEEVASDLADKLTAALEFDGGTVKDGPQPEGQAGDDAPQIENVEMEAEIEMGSTFEIGLEQGEPVVEDTANAIVYVDGSTKYIEVPLEEFRRKAGPMFVLGGTFAQNPDLQGQSFSLEFALQTGGGVTGLYQGKQLVVPEKSGDTNVGDDDDDTSGQTDDDDDTDVAKCGCDCVAGELGFDCTPNPEGTTFTYVGCGPWPDADQCTGWHSVLPTELADTNAQVDDGTEYGDESCAITIHCP